MGCPEGIRVFIDANLTGLGAYLASRSEDFIHVGHPEWPLSPDASDEEWLDFVGDCGWSVLMRDKMIRQRPRERAMLEKHRMTAVVIATRRNLNLAEQQDLIDEHWDALQEVFLSAVPGLYHLTQGGVRQMEPF